VFASLRYMYWPQAFSWIGSPLILWSLIVFLLVDCSYGICFYYVRQYERSLAAGQKQKGC
jgi:paspaline synthase